jgi:hypothetical protein
MPWEGTLAPDLQRCLGLLKHPVLSLLMRDPSTRHSAQQFSDHCSRLLASEMVIVDCLPPAHAQVSAHPGRVYCRAFVVPV